jgi:hypothetical protein
MTSTGTWTFVFTDIEGSSKLWERDPEGGGKVFKTMGDAFCAAFSSASDALKAAIEIQRKISSHEWAGFGPIRVRVGLHSGEAEHRDDDYFGPALNRAARLISIGHGGQILLSQGTYELVRESVKSGQAEFRFLGEQRLRDLERAVGVYQATAPGIEAEFPPVKSLSEMPNNLPLQVTSFIGRESELKKVQELVAKSRMVTLTGSGGTGKTRLSLQASAELLAEFEHGAWFVELAPLSEPELVAQSIAG